MEDVKPQKSAGFCLQRLPACRGSPASSSSGASPPGRAPAMLREGPVRPSHPLPSTSPQLADDFLLPAPSLSASGSRANTFLFGLASGLPPSSPSVVVRVVVVAGPTSGRRRRARFLRPRASLACSSAAVAGPDVSGGRRIRPRLPARPTGDGDDDGEDDDEDDDALPRRRPVLAGRSFVLQPDIHQPGRLASPDRKRKWALFEPHGQKRGLRAPAHQWLQGFRACAVAAGCSWVSQVEWRQLTPSW